MVYWEGVCLVLLSSYFLFIASLNLATPGEVKCMVFEVVSSFILAVPEVFMGVSLCFLLVLCSYFFTRGDSLLYQKEFFCMIFYLLSCLFMLVVNGLDIFQFGFYGSVVFDPVSQFCKLFICGLLFFFFVFLKSVSSGKGFFSFEYSLLVLFCGLGVLLMVSVYDFISLYLCMELQALGFYVLACSQKGSSFSTEAGLKYFVVGAFMSGIYLFGVSVLYGCSGCFSFEELSRLFFVGFYNEGVPVIFMVSFMFIVSSFFFKLSVAPWHQWALDVYQGSPFVSVAFFSSVPKVGFIVCLSRLLFGPFYFISSFWQGILLVCCVFCLVLGVFGAFYQFSVKSFLVYSSMGHLSFLLLGFSCCSTEGVHASFFYMFVYLVTSLVFFSVLSGFTSKGSLGVVRYLSELQLLRYENGSLLFIFCAIFFSMAGIPPLAGFFVKFFIFFSAVEASYFFVVFCFVIFSVVSCFYYLSVLKLLFFDDFMVSLCMSSSGYTYNTSKEVCFFQGLGFFFLILLGLFPGSVYEGMLCFSYYVMLFVLDVPK